MKRNHWVLLCCALLLACFLALPAQASETPARAKYVNPKGGIMLHEDPYCPDTSKDVQPLTAVPAQQIEAGIFSGFTECTTCTGYTAYYASAESGGYYHLDPNCSTVAENYRPLRAVTRQYANTDAFKQMKACTVCANATPYYYNPLGGISYHMDANCPIVREDLRPMMPVGSAETLAQLTPCQYCVTATEVTGYVNPDGGSYLHADPNCASVATQYRPLSAVLPGTDLSGLLPCPQCNAGGQIPTVTQAPQSPQTAFQPQAEIQPVATQPFGVQPVITPPLLAQPTIAPAATIQYYNASGGTYLHTNPDCPAVDAKFKPMSVVPAGMNTAGFQSCPDCATDAPAPAVAPQTSLQSSSISEYYNPSGGSYLHTDPYCKSVDPKYRPLTLVPAGTNMARMEYCPDCYTTSQSADARYYNPSGGSYLHKDAYCKSVDPKYRPLKLASPSTDVSRLQACPDCINSEPQAQINTPAASTPTAAVHYVNPQGGSHLHLDPNCTSVAKQYLPLTSVLDAKFSDETLARMTICPYCGGAEAATLTEAAAGSFLYINPNGGSYLHLNPRCSSVSDQYLPLSAFDPATADAAALSKLSACADCAKKEKRYYNPEGGSYIHADANCTTVHEKYLPLTPLAFTTEKLFIILKMQPCPRCMNP